MTVRQNESPHLSVIVVTYNSKATIGAMWRSLYPQLARVAPWELYVIDNASTDETFAVLQDSIAGMDAAASGGCVALHRNLANLGFGGACNQALRECSGRYVLLLNPDTELEPDALQAALDYMEANPAVGILGPRIRLPDGRLDAPCRRSFKTPGIYFYKLSGLSRLFPHSRRFGRYYLSYLDELETTEVDAVIGAFMLVRREVINQIGLLDDRFFMYCEDEDWCFRAKQAGWRVVYYPKVTVWHRKGSSAKQRAARMIWEWHKSILLFHRKNLAQAYPWPVNLLLYGGFGLSLFASLAKSVAAGRLSTAACALAAIVNVPSRYRRPRHP